MNISPNHFIVIATQHKNDHPWLEKALRGDAAYVAPVANPHRARLVLDYLAAEGLPAEKIARVCAPAGFDLGAATPEEIALSIISQIVAVRRGGTSRPLHLRETGLALTTNPPDRLITRCDTADSE